jgi:hypothetical protein
MGYFKSTSFKCIHYPGEWSRVLMQIQGWGSSYPISGGVSQPLEAKALYVFTVARRLTRAAHWLDERANGWKPVFIEATVLLFPMLELIGYARLDDRQVSKHHPTRKGIPADVSNVNLWAGLHWLRDPNWLPVVGDNRQKTDTTQLGRWQIGHLVSLRHYLLHGSKKAKDEKGKPIPIDDIINYELPGFIVERAQQTMPDYWEQLKQDSGSQGWLEHLARADIRPLKLQGSNFFEEGLVDPDIVDCLEGNASFLS